MGTKYYEQSKKMGDCIEKGVIYNEVFLLSEAFGFGFLGIEPLAQIKRNFPLPTPKDRFSERHAERSESLSRSFRGIPRGSGNDKFNHTWDL
jgi:hypothetical protein